MKQSFYEYCMETDKTALYAEWDHEKNELDPMKTPPKSGRDAWWICEKGHSFKARISARTSGGTCCPYCTNKKVLPGFNDLATLKPLLAAQWHPEKNGDMTPKDVTCGSARMVWWKCPSCGYEWRNLVYSRAGHQNSGCPVCVGKGKRANSPAVYRRAAGG